MKYEGMGHITAMEMWDEDSLTREVQAFIRIKRDGGGEFQFGLVSGRIDGEVVKTDGGERFEFTWGGNDECDPASGRGGLERTAQNGREGEIKIHQGDGSALTAKRAK